MSWTTGLFEAAWYLLPAARQISGRPSPPSPGRGLPGRLHGVVVVTEHLRVVESREAACRDRDDVVDGGAGREAGTSGVVPEVLAEAGVPPPGEGPEAAPDAPVRRGGSGVPPRGGRGPAQDTSQGYFLCFLDSLKGPLGRGPLLRAAPEGCPEEQKEPPSGRLSGNPNLEVRSFARRARLLPHSEREAAPRSPRRHGRRCEPPHRTLPPLNAAPSGTGTAAEQGREPIPIRATRPARITTYGK